MVFPAKADALLAAWLYLIVARSKEILIVLKSHDERTKEERRLVERGLIKSLVFEGLIFTPASVALLLLLSPPILQRFHVPEITAYILIGVVS